MKTKIMFYADSWKATSGYGRVVRELASRLAKNVNNVIYVQQIVDMTPAHIDNGVKILPAYGQRGTDMFVSSVVNNLRMLNPDVFIPICDPFLITRDGLSKIEYTNKFMLYMPLDSVGVPDTAEDTLNKCDHIFIMSEDGKKQLDEAGYTNNSVLYHGVNTNEFTPVTKEKQNELKKEFEFEEDDIIFFAVGRNFPRKRPMRLIEAIALWTKKYNNEKVKFLFHVSDHDKDPYSLPKFIKRMEKRYDVKLNNIIFSKSHNLGNGLKEDTFIKMYQLSDYYISATSGEGFGLPTIEAMSCKKPVIIPNNSTGPELTGNGEWAYLVDNEGFQNTGFGTQQPLVDINKLAETIQTVIDEDNTEKVEKAYKFVKEKCNWDLIAFEMENQIKNGLR